MELARYMYNRYWRREAQGVFSLAINIVFCKIAGLLYSVKYRQALKATKAHIEIESSFNKDKDVFVFANGPSLKDVDFKKIAKMKERGYDVIALNSFISKTAHILAPDYVVFADKIHFGLKASESDQYRKDMDWCINNNITMFVPAHYSHLVKSEGKLSFNAFSEIYSKNTSDITKPLGYYPLTALYALSIAKALGYRKLLIAGFDNSYFKEFEIGESSEAIINHKHYYDAENDDTQIKQKGMPTSEVFFDFYRHFKFIEKVTSGESCFENISKSTYLNTIKRNLSLDIYNDSQV